MLTSVTDKRMYSSGNLDYCDVLSEADMHRTNAKS